MNTVYQDTIAAISTASAPSGIGIVRISGKEAVPVAEKVFRAANGKSLSEAESHTMQYGHVEAEGKLLDEVLVSVFRAPRTYTREDIVEINCHGGTLILRSVLEAVLKAGARMAEPGEFTKRAFLNGRIDLTQAEAVMDLIGSENRIAAESALSHLGGTMRRKIVSLREALLYEMAYIEAALDDPEHYDLTGYGQELQGKLQTIRSEIRHLLDTAEEGRMVKEGIATVILGQPNVGKSTLLNLISGEERAIVTDIAGTTRDILEEHVMLQGIPLRVMDTAGLRETGDKIEQIGVERARACAEKADLILYLVDGSRSLSETDRKNLQELCEALSDHPYLQQAREAGCAFLNGWHFNLLLQFMFLWQILSSILFQPPHEINAKFVMYFIAQSHDVRIFILQGILILGCKSLGISEKPWDTEIHDAP